MRFVNLHYEKGGENVGDVYSAPARHAAALGLDGHVFKMFDHTQAKDAFRFGDGLIIGGGGLAGPYFPWIKSFGDIKDEQLRRVVVWGVGTNYHDRTRNYIRRGIVTERTGLEYPAWVKRIEGGGGLVGVRDYGGPFRWVPCVSAMLKQFDALRETKPTQRVVAYEHHEKMLGFDLGYGMEALANDAPLDAALAHLASAEVVVTNTYHGAYWATLLGRRVVVAGAYSNRFRFLKHPPAFVDSPMEWQAAAESAKLYPSALEECRAANLKMVGDVKARFGL